MRGLDLFLSLIEAWRGEPAARRGVEEVRASSEEPSDMWDETEDLSEKVHRWDQP